MLKFNLKSIVVAGFAVSMLASCTSIDKTLREPNTLVRFEKKDFTLSDQVSGEASETKILGIDFARLFLTKRGAVEGGASSASVPVVGSLLQMDYTKNYALYELMQNNAGYDVVFYPQFETKVVKPLAAGVIFKITTVKTTARLAKLNK